MKYGIIITNKENKIVNVISNINRYDNWSKGIFELLDTNEYNLIEIINASDDCERWCQLQRK